MISESDVAGLAPYLAGPGAAVIVLMAVLYGLYRLVVGHAVPLVSALGKRHLDQIDLMLSSRQAESVAIMKTLSSIDRRLARIEGLTDAGVFTPNPGAQSPDRST